MGKTAIVIGATGLTGGIVLNLLLFDKRYTSVKVFTRRSTGIQHEKLEEFIGDLLTLESMHENFHGDEVYVCIGTTKKKTPNEDAYRAIDIGIPVTCAQLAVENKIEKIAIISAIGADEKSSFVYNRIKGEMERKVLALNVTKTYILRPSLIVGKRDEARFLEGFANKLFKVIDYLLIGPLWKYRSVSAERIAMKMIALCNSSEPSRIIESNEL